MKLDDYCIEFITINIGVKQGGILSPLYYNVYVDDLMKELKHTNLGCKIGGLYFGTAFYADDIILLGVSVKKLKKWLKFVVIIVVDMIFILIRLKLNGCILMYMVLAKMSISRSMG